MAIPFIVGTTSPTINGGCGGDWFSSVMNITVPANSTYTVGQGTFIMLPVSNLVVAVQTTGTIGAIAGTYYNMIASGAGGMFVSDGSGFVRICNTSGGNLTTQLIQMR